MNPMLLVRCPSVPYMEKYIGSLQTLLIPYRHPTRTRCHWVMTYQVRSLKVPAAFLTQQFTSIVLDPESTPQSLGTSQGAYLLRWPYGCEGPALEFGWMVLPVCCLQKITSRDENKTVTTTFEPNLKQALLNNRQDRGYCTDPDSRLKLRMWYWITLVREGLIKSQPTRLCTSWLWPIRAKNNADVLPAYKLPRIYPVQLDSQACSWQPPLSIPLHSRK